MNARFLNVEEKIAKVEEEIRDLKKEGSTRSKK